MTSTEQGQRGTQARGRARRDALLSAARILLEDQRLEDITVSAVAEAANIPCSSAYHFFPEIRVLLMDLARVLSNEIFCLKLAISNDAPWQNVVAETLESAATYFNGDAAARQIFLGPRATPEIRLAGCQDDIRFGAMLHRTLDTRFHLPYLANAELIFYRSITIAESLFILSVCGSSSITEEMKIEAVRAATSYLASYLPPVLMAKTSCPSRPTKS